MTMRKYVQDMNMQMKKRIALEKLTLKKGKIAHLNSEQKLKINGGISDIFKTRRCTLTDKDF